MRHDIRKEPWAHETLQAREETMHSQRQRGQKEGKPAVSGNMGAVGTEHLSRKEKSIASKLLTTVNTNYYWH